MGEFYQKFADKTIAFDPMDRPIPDEETDDMTKRDELVKILEVDMLPNAISGKMLQAPIMNEPYQRLMDMFEQANKVCIEIRD